MKTVQVYFRTVERKNPSMQGRPEWFSYEKCWNNLLLTTHNYLVDINVIIDTKNDDFVQMFKSAFNQRVEIIDSSKRLESLLEDYEKNDVTYTDRTESGEEIVKREEPPDNEKAAGQLLYEIINSDDLEEDKLVYIVEDDYLHLNNWAEILINFYQMYPGLHYVSLYDHPDKYSERYKGLQTHLYVGGVNHWKTVPSTCGTWAAPAIALKEDYDIHHDRLGDHNKWMKLAERKRAVLSCIPGRATHCMQNYLSPYVNWSKV